MDDTERVEPTVIHSLAEIRPPDLGSQVHNIVIQLPPQRRSGPHWAVIVLFVALLLGVVAVIGLALESYRMQQFTKAITLMDSSFARPVPAPVHYPAGSSPQFPPSQTLRLDGTVNDGQVRYIATSSVNPEYVMIPPKDCRLISGAPVCHYQGRTVTRFTG